MTCKKPLACPRTAALNQLCILHKANSPRQEVTQARLVTFKVKQLKLLKKKLF